MPSDSVLVSPDYVRTLFCRSWQHLTICHCSMVNGVQTMGLEAARGAAYSMAAMTDAKPSPSGSGEQISSTLGALSIAELYEIMAQMKGLVQQNPPQVGFASGSFVLFAGWCHCNQTHCNSN